MRKFSNLLFASICALSLLASCAGKDGDPGPAGAPGAPGAPGATGGTGPSGQNLTGTMYGFTNPIDEFGAPLPKSGITVTLEGTTPAVTATTNADGRYEFAGLRNGTYNLVFSRTGLGSFRRLGVGHVGGDQPTFLGTTTVSANSTTVVGTISLTTTTLGSTLTIPFSNPNAPSGTFVRLAIYASSSPSVNSTNGTLLFTTSSTTSPLQTSLTKATLNNAGFASGTPVYLVVYGSPNSLLGYTDPQTGRTIYTGLSASSSNQLAFIVP